MFVFLRMFCGCMLQLAPFAPLCFYPFKEHFRFSAKHTWLMTGGLITLLSLLFAGTCCYLQTVCPAGQILFNCANVAFFVCLLVGLLWYIYAVQEIWQKKLYIAAFTMTSALTMTSIGNALDAKLRTTNVGCGLPYNPSALITLAILTAVVIPLLWLLLKNAYLPVAEGLNSKESSYLAVLSILLFILLASSLVPIDYETLFQPQQLFIYIVLLTTVFACHFICFKLFYQAHTKFVTQQNLMQVEHQLEIRDEQYKRILNNIENNRKMRHDFRHHTLALQGFLTAGELQKAEEYLNQFATILDEQTPDVFSTNTVVNTIIGYYQALANSKEIDFNIRIAVPPQLAIQDSDLAVILGNLLENALTATAVAHKEQRYIRINMICSGKMLAITVDNGFNGIIKTHHNSYTSIKDNHHGIGLNSITMIADKYGGGVQFTHEPLIFHAAVMLNIGENKQQRATE